MNILAFMQNQWFNDPARVEKMYARAKIEGNYWDIRNRIITYSLFAGCKSGKVLHTIFGEELCDEIYWEEASPLCGGKASDLFPADIVHMLAVVQEVKPEIIICFGRSAQSMMPKLQAQFKGPMLSAPHPAARQADVYDLLRSTNLRLKELMAKPLPKPVDYAKEFKQQYLCEFTQPEPKNETRHP